MGRHCSHHHHSDSSIIFIIRAACTSFVQPNLVSIFIITVAVEDTVPLLRIVVWGMRTSKTVMKSKSVQCSSKRPNAISLFDQYGSRDCVEGSCTAIKKMQLSSKALYLGANFVTEYCHVRIRAEWRIGMDIALPVGWFVYFDLPKHPYTMEHYFVVRHAFAYVVDHDVRGE